MRYLYIWWDVMFSDFAWYRRLRGGKWTSQVHMDYRGFEHKPVWTRDERSHN